MTSSSILSAPLNQGMRMRSEITENTAATFSLGTLFPLRHWSTALSSSSHSQQNARIWDLWPWRFWNSQQHNGEASDVIFTDKFIIQRCLLHFSIPMQPSLLKPDATQEQTHTIFKFGFEPSSIFLEPAFFEPELQKCFIYHPLKSLKVFWGDSVKTCEVLPCSILRAIIFLGSIVLTSQWLLCIHCFTSLVSFAAQAVLLTLLDYWIRETPDFWPNLPVSRLKCEISRKSPFAISSVDSTFRE